MKKLIPKMTGTYADPLCAIGYASLLEEMTASPARIEDRDAYYVVTVQNGDDIDRWPPPTPGFLFIWRKSKEACPRGSNILDYEHEQQIKEQIKKSTATKAAKRNIKAALEEVTEEGKRSV